MCSEALFFRGHFGKAVSVTMQVFYVVAVTRQRMFCRRLVAARPSCKLDVCGSLHASQHAFNCCQGQSTLPLSNGYGGGFGCIFLLFTTVFTTLSSCHLIVRVTLTASLQISHRVFVSAQSFVAVQRQIRMIKSVDEKLFAKHVNFHAD
ncbi:unnamed protein product [Polarella glacialis]|uniref:Uncharacterized protein n=1 Tax=Polarella glacialis TaxID=89957 RepID=A0A813HTR0_POLGL|nr:unnamed protein product [Polarella glacialis]